MIERPNKSRTLIIGGGGFIGSNIAMKAFEQRRKLVLLDKFRVYNHHLMDHEAQLLIERKKYLTKVGSVITGTACDAELVSNIVTDHNVDCVIHSAGTPLLKFAENNPEEAAEDILNSVKKTISALIGTNVRRFVFLSSSTVYGDFTSQSASEDDPLRPFGVYASLKKQAEDYIHNACAECGLPFTIIRPTAVYGWGDVNPRVVQTMVHDAFTKSIIDVNGANELLDFTHVDDVANGVLRASANPNTHNEAFNISKGESRSLLELAQIISGMIKNTNIRVNGRDLEVPKRGTLNINKARQLFDYNPRISLDEGVTDFVNSYKRYLGLNNE